MLRTARLTAVAVLPIVLLTACGGGSDSKKASGLSKADYITKSEAICAKANTDLKAIPEPAKPEDLSTTFATGLGIATKATAELTLLANAQPDKAELTKIFTGPLALQLTALKDYAPKITAAIQGGESALNALPDPDLPKADTAAMTTYGFKDCVETASNE